jgi:glycerophosphoryl diester phosphodiesterase
LRELVSQAHAKGRRVRFWATPENPKLWNELRAAQVDLIGTDNLGKLADFFRE